MYLYYIVVAIWLFMKLAALPMAFLSAFVWLFLSKPKGKPDPGYEQEVRPFENKSLWKHAPLAHALIFFTVGGMLMLGAPPIGQFVGFWCVLTGFVDWFCQFVYVGRARENPKAY